MRRRIVNKTVRGKAIVEDTLGDALRKEFCLCFNCRYFGGNCQIFAIAKAELIEPYGFTFMVTRCPDFQF